MYLTKKSLIVLLSGFCLFFIVSGQSVTEPTATVSATTASGSSLTATPSTSIIPSSATSSQNVNNSSSIIPTNTSSTSSSPIPTVQSTGWDPDGNQSASNQQSWLREHNRFVFIIFVGLLLLGLLIWYIVKSVKGMRKRLETENNAQLYMMQQATGMSQSQQQQQQQQQPPPPPPPPSSTTATNNQFAAQPSEQPIPETSPPPPAYKAEDYRPTAPHNDQQPHY